MIDPEKINPADEVRRAMGESELIRGLQRARGHLSNARPLTPEQISLLEQAGNRCSDWSAVKVSEDFDPAFVQNTRFHGKVKIGATGRTTKLSGTEVASGIYDSVVADSVICDGAYVSGVGLLANMIVEPEAVVCNCCEVSCSAGARFGNGSELPVAIESGGREVATYAEITIPVAAHVGGQRADVEMIEAYRAAMVEYVRAATSDVGVIAERAQLRGTPVVRNTFLGPHACVDGATWIENVTILSNEAERTHVTSGAYVKDALIQWGCEVATMAIVVNSTMTEHSYAERHGKITDSIVGPNTGVAEGELTASLLGPFVGFHHQALLIAAFWPEGKGNIGYGANVGSNHTSKAPDQEIWPGEGTFFGLGVNIKFPVDFSRAPYTIIASGVTTLPQKMTFPFSLINSPAASHESISPAYNEIFPGWVLSDNIYTVRRNEKKYKKRDKSRRSQFVFDVFRPDTVELMLDARRRLEAAGGKAIYTEKEIPGLGKNFVAEQSRVKGIEAYGFYARYYALLGLKNMVETAHEPRGVLDRPSDSRVSEHQRGIIQSEFPGEDVIALLKRFVEAQQRIARDVLVSKQKDDARGARIINDYASAHTCADEDEFVIQTQEETIALQKEVEALLEKIG